MREPLLHQAILEGDRQKIEKLGASDRHKLLTNSLGLNALELATLLGKEEVLSWLGEAKPPPKIKVLLEGESTISSCSREEFEALFHVSWRSRLYFTHYNLLRWTMRHPPFLLAKTECGAKVKELGKEYLYFLKAGYVADLSIQWIDKKIGYGVFAHSNLEEGEYVGEYTGEVRNAWKTWHFLDLNPYCFHYPTRFLSMRYMVVDAFSQGNTLRFLNHSDRPNLKVEMLYDRGLLHIVFFANGPICRGSHLTFNYGQDFWRRRKKQG